MDLSQFRVLPGEQPLDRLVSDGGFTGIFRTIACVGDSLSSGEFESIGCEGQPTYHDFYDYSWGQYIARMAGCKVYNFSRGGMTAKEYAESFAAINDFWNPDKAAQAYIFAMGANDLYGLKQPVGSMADIKDPPATPSFAQYMHGIILRHKNNAPHARIFLITMPRQPQLGEEHERIADEHARLMYEMADYYKYTYVIDLRRYGPVYDEEFCRDFFLHGHLNAAGYLLTAKMVTSYIDYLVRKDPADFAQAGFIGTQFYKDEV